MNVLIPFIYFDIDKALSYYVDCYNAKRLYVSYKLITSGIELVIVSGGEILGFAIFKSNDDRYIMTSSMFKNKEAYEYFNKFGRLYLPEEKVNKVCKEGTVYELLEEQ